MGNEFHAGAATVGWIVTGYLIASAVLSVPFGRLADLTGRKRILAIGIFSFSIFSGAAVFAGSMAVILLFRVLQGVAGAMIFSTKSRC
jgi:MFS family permease